MTVSPRIREENAFLWERLAAFLRGKATLSPEAVAEVAACGVSREAACSLLLAAELGLDTEKPREAELVRAVFPTLLRELEPGPYRENPFFRLPLSGGRVGSWELKTAAYAPFEVFVREEALVTAEGRRIPRLGYFPEPFSFPAVLEKGVEWMTLTPHEIATMAAPLREARGRVLTYGLGLGYFAFMAAEKPEVASVTVVEREPAALRLFTGHILPHFPHREKIRLVEDDAFHYAEKTAPGEGYDFVFTDLWHDAGDGLPLYLRMKALDTAHPGPRYRYWIEPTLRLYLEG